MTRHPVHKDLRTPKYKMRVVADKKKKGSKAECRKSSNGQPEAPEPDGFPPKEGDRSPNT